MSVKPATPNRLPIIPTKSKPSVASDEQPQSTQVNTVARCWLRSDRAAAAAWNNGLSLPDETKQFTENEMTG